MLQTWRKQNDSKNGWKKRTPKIEVWSKYTQDNQIQNLSVPVVDSVAVVVWLKVFFESWDVVFVQGPFG